MKKKFLFNEVYFPLFLLLLCVISYGLTLFLGYFWDDWFVIWNLHAMGARGVFESYAMDRPIHGYVLGYLMQAIGDAPKTWHIVTLLVRYAGAVAVWQLLRQLWPKRSYENALVALCVALYPGFTQQAMTVNYILLVFGAMTLWALSNLLMLYAYRHKKIKLILITLSCILLLAHLALSEYFIGLEFIRPLLIGLAFAQVTTLDIRSSWRTWIKEIFSIWLPYLATLIIYLIYRLIFFQSGRLATDSSTVFQQILSNPVTEVSHRVASILTDPVEVTILAWLQPVNKFFAAYGLSPRIWWGCMSIFVLATCLTWAFLTSLNEPENIAKNQHPRWNFQALGLGLTAVIFAGIPLWGINREAALGGLDDRYTFPFIFGSALILVSSLNGLVKNQKNRSIVAAILIGISVGFHVWNTFVIYRIDWENQQYFHSQLFWRVPGLQKGTSIWVVKDSSVLAMEGDYGLAMPVNWIYGPDQHNTELNYWVFPLTDEFLSRSGLFQPGIEIPIHRTVRNVAFTGNPSQTVVVWFAPPACLKVIDPNQQELLQVIPLPTIAQSMAHIDPIINNPVMTIFPENILGTQTKKWCYYFEKADLARQSMDWQEVARLGGQAAQEGLIPSNESEWLPFIEADIHLNRFDDALRLINLVNKGQLFASKKMICGLTNRMTNNILTDSAQNKFLQVTLQQNGCSALPK